MDVAYTALPNIATHSDLTVLSVPDANIMPVIDNESGKILSTDALEVGVTMGDAYNSQVPYDSATMGEWEIRLVQRPDWNTVEEIAGWVRADGAGHAAFEVPVEKLAGKNLRVYAEARVVSPEPAYQETRTSPRPLSIVILNGAALDGSVRALRLTGEAPMRVTLFAEVNNRSWARDLGNVRWEMSTNGGEWQTVSNPSNAPQRLATTLQKGSYMIRAELTNKNSGAKSMTQAIEINAFNIPKGYLAGTPLASAMWPAAGDLLRAKGQRKVLIISTDGDPRNVTDVIDMVARCRASGIEVFAIAYGEAKATKLQLMFGTGHWQLLDDLGQLRSALQALVQRVLTQAA